MLESVTSHAIGQGLITGFALGWIYILASLGLALVFGIMHIVHLAHGQVYMLGGYVVLYLTTLIGMHFFPALLISMVVMGAFGLFLERVFFRPVVGNIMSGMCVAIGLFLILEAVAAVSFGVSDMRISGLASGSFKILDWALPKDRSVAVGVGMILLLLFYILIKRSKYGQAMVATAQNREGIMLQGVNPNRMSQLVMFIGSAFAAAAGALAGAIFLLNPYIGGPALMNAIIVVVLAGLGSVLGIVISGLMVGFANAILPIIFGAGVGAVAPFVLIMLILIFKPLGLFGHE